mgnify:CR=1 FL=1
MSNQQRRAWSLESWQLPLLLLVVYLLLALTSVRNKVSVYDEHPHICSGLSYLNSGDLSGGLDNPPLAQLVIVLPAWLFGVDYAPFVDKGLLWFRLPAVLTGFLLGLLIYCWTERRYGKKGALFSLFLYVFCTAMMGVARFAVLDIFAAFCFALVLFSLDEFLRARKGLLLEWTALCTALAICVKYTLLPLALLVPLLLFLAPKADEGNFWQRMYGSFHRAEVKKRALWLLRFALVLLVSINALFLFQGSGQKKEIPDGLRAVILYEGLTVLETFGRFLPQPFVRGLAGKMAQARIMQSAGAYFNGQWVRGGYWYYFLACLGLKLPLSLLLIILLWAILSLRKQLVQGDELFILLLPTLLLLFFFCIAVRVNIGFRHILFILPPIYALAGALIPWLEGQQSKNLRYGFYLLLVIYVAANLLVYPHYLQFFSWAIGGPKNGHLWLSDSNLDWGQDDNLPLQWAEKSGAGPLKINTDPYKAGEGWYALSVNARQGMAFPLHDKAGRKPWAWLTRFEPHLRLANTWFIYKVTIDDFKKFVQRYPQDPWARVDLAVVKLGKRDLQGAFDELMEAHRLEPAGRAETMFRLGQVALAVGELVEAERHFKAARLLAPWRKRLELYYDIALVEMELERLRKHGRHKSTLRLAKPLLLRKARAYTLLADFSVARHLFQLVRNADGEGDAAYWFNLANFYERIGDFTKAQGAAQKARQLAPQVKTFQAHYNALAEIVEKTKSKDPRQLVTVGDYLAKIGNHSKARNFYLLAWKLNPAWPEPLWRLGQQEIHRRVGLTRFRGW